MPRYDVRCKQCGAEQEIECRMVDLEAQRCFQVYPDVGLSCGGELEVLVAAVPTTKGGFGYAPGLVQNGKIHRAPKRSPATAIKVR